MSPIRFYADKTEASQLVERELHKAKVDFTKVVVPSGTRTPPAIDCDSGYYEGLAEIEVYFLGPLR